tara:strand:+ start:6699 stop:7517 length:819 start_codon:yes stop_codon:yes gene_type:complete
MKLGDSRVIYESETKQTKVYITDDCLVKVINKKSPYYGSFLKELEYYKIFSGNVAPRLITSDDTSFSTQFLRGGVLKDYVENIEPCELENVLMKVIIALEAFNSVSVVETQGQKTGGFKFIRAFVGKITILLLSGPKGIESSTREKKLNKIFSIGLKPFSIILGCLSLIILSSTKSMLLGKRFHGDLHLNNIILDENNHVFLVDFENVEEYSGKFVDLLYFFSILVSKLDSSKRRKLSRVIFAYFSLSSLEKLVWIAGCSIMSVAINRNSRF